MTRNSELSRSRDTPTMADVREAVERVGPHIHRTPVFTSSYIDSVSGATVFLKAENLQKVGAFKARGATNAILSLTDEEAARGVITHSSGNHGQAVAFSARLRGIQAIVVMPESATKLKIEAVRGYGARVEFSTLLGRDQKVSELISERGYTEIHPFDNPLVIAGQATASLELVEDVDDMDVLLAPIGGGGLLSGASLVGSEYGIDVVGAEPEIVDDSYRSLRDGVRYPATGALSVADGLLTGIGEIPFRILSSSGRRILTVTESEITEAAVLLSERTKLVVEPSGAAAVAALLSNSEDFTGRRVGVILSGGNTPSRLQ